MKKLLFLASIVLGMSGIACQSANHAIVKITNPDNKPVAFTGYYKSDMVDSSGVDGTTPATYEVEVNPDGDHVYVGFVKATVTDSENELKVELYYKGDLKEAQTVTVPILGWAFLDAEIP